MVVLASVKELGRVEALDIVAHLLVGAAWVVPLLVSAAG